MADAWLYNYTDFGEGRGRSPQPVRPAVVEVATPHAPATFQAVIDTGGPITVVAAGLLDTGGDPVATGFQPYSGGLPLIVAQVDLGGDNSVAGAVFYAWLDEQFDVSGPVGWRSTVILVGDVCARSGSAGRDICV